VVQIEKEEVVNVLVKEINKLFITNRQSYILQNADGTYVNSKSFKKSTLTDSIIKSHLKLKHTVGIFCNPFSSNFICFDLDLADHNHNERTTKVSWKMQKNHP
jgi:hypothetical protein